MKVLSLIKPETLELQERKIPSPGKDEALIKINTVAICGSDIHAYKGQQAIFDYPRVMGHEICATIEQIDDNKILKKGDKVVVIPYKSCGKCIACRKGKTECCEHLEVTGVHVDGGFCEYMVVPNKYLLKVDPNMDYKDLCLVEPFSISAHAVHRAQVKEGENVLVIGIGPIGMGVAAIAKTYKAKVMIADVSPERRAFAKDNLGYQNILNPLDSDYKEQLASYTNGDMPDTIIDATGNASSMSNVFKYLSAGGKVVYVGIASNDLVINHVEFHKRQTDLYGSRAATRVDFEYVVECIEKGLINPSLFVTDEIKFDENIVESFKGLMEKGSAMFKGVVKVI
jgi:2-desacetyl-2-hydroxyethyl bacteriochlorophyllide A dehydrogenase